MDSADSLVEQVKFVSIFVQGALYGRWPSSYSWTGSLLKKFANTLRGIHRHLRLDTLEVGPLSTSKTSNKQIHVGRFTDDADPGHSHVPWTCVRGSIVTGAGAALLSRHNVSSFARQAWLYAFLTSTLAASISCTLIAATQIWSSGRKNLRRQHDALRSIITCIVLESGCIYSAALLTLVILLAVRSWFEHVLIDSMPLIITIVFSIVVFRMGASNPSDPREFSTGFLVDSDSNLKPVTRFNLRLPGQKPTRDSGTLSPSHFWPVQPDRSLPGYLPPQLQEQQRQRNKGSKTGFLQNALHRGCSTGQGREQGHYNLRSQTKHPLSYFRASEELAVDMELEAEIDQARWQRPKALPPALMLPRSDPGII
ncbi:hypothetical protein NP233_g708 [Leucocoprinus birnbaumii]|uniref:Transmembrane protein n=1 Tax=Leucocoprinus birnbaumii TaxID=56174 RepID=A0AAD5W3Z0_9AGAR|nr:hypothetical protein NP233_g708 [Leucocoprinus birnbaumii]